MAITFGDLLDDADWKPMSPDQQSYEKYLWFDGRLLADAPVDFAATFDDAMWVTRKPIGVFTFNRNPLKARANFVVPRHHHNVDEMIFVLEGEYSIEHGEEGAEQTIRIGRGEFFLSRAGTPYTMTSGPEGVIYVETWPTPVVELETYWYDVGWVRR